MRYISIITLSFFLMLSTSATAASVADQALHTACQQGDIAAVEAALANGADVLALDEQNQSILSKAYLWPKITKILLDKGADPNAGTYPALVSAASSYSVEVMELLLTAGAKPDLPGFVKNEATEKIKGMIADMETKANKARGKSKKILQAGVDQLKAQYPDLDGPGLKFYAIQNVIMQTNCVQCLEKLINHGANLNLGVENNMNQIHQFAIYGMTAAQRRDVFAKGRKIMEETYLTKTPEWYGNLPSSLNKEPEQMLAVLLKAGLDINKLDVNERTPLHHGMAGGVGNKSEIMTALVRAGADIGLEDPLFGKPFTLAVKTGEIKLVQMFLDQGADINEGSKIIDMNLGQRLKDASPLMAAVIKDNLEMVMFLVSKGAKVKQGAHGLSANMKTG